MTASPRSRHGLAARGWTVDRLSGSVRDLLDAQEPPPQGSRRLRIYEVQRPALVLGSAQRLDAVDARVIAGAGAPAEDAPTQADGCIPGVDVLKRRSGGGAVLLEPGRQVWADFFVGADDALWRDDVSRSALWVGALWSDVVRGLIGAQPIIHTGRLAADAWGELICFAGRGPGEVFVHGRKVVGVSQHRNRRRARIQTLARISPEAEPPGVPLRSEADYLALSPLQRANARGVPSQRSGTITARARAVIDSLLEALIEL